MRHGSTRADPGLRLGARGGARDKVFRRCARASRPNSAACWTKLTRPRIAGAAAYAGRGMRAVDHRERPADTDDEDQVRNIEASVAAQVDGWCVQPGKVPWA